MRRADSRENFAHDKEEVPHSIAVTIEDMRVEENGTVYISAVILWNATPKRYHYRQAGCSVKEVGRQARQDIQRLLGSKIFLELWVKVKKIGVTKNAFFAISDFTAGNNEPLCKSKENHTRRLPTIAFHKSALGAHPNFRRCETPFPKRG